VSEPHSLPVTEAGQSLSRYIIGLGISTIYADESIRNVEEEAAGTVERIDPLRLARALHTISHQFAHLWDVTPDCGCILTASYLAASYMEDGSNDDPAREDGADRGDDRSADGPVE
jgi:hypothetical protein